MILERYDIPDSEDEEKTQPRKVAEVYAYLWLKKEAEEMAEEQRRKKQT